MKWHGSFEGTEEDGAELRARRKTDIYALVALSNSSASNDK
jgi:hypothetical protein